MILTNAFGLVLQKETGLKLKSILIGISLMVILITIKSNGIALADPPHCDRAGFPSCYDVGFGDDQANPGTTCPSGHSAVFCSGWNAGANSGGGSTSKSNADTTSTSTTSSDWTLNVNLKQTKFGTSSATVGLTGPFGYTNGKTTPTNSSPSVTFTVPSNQVPNGKQYKLCVSAEFLTISTIVPNCKYFTHMSGDETQSMDIPG